MSQGEYEQHIKQTDCGKKLQNIRARRSQRLAGKRQMKAGATMTDAAPLTPPAVRVFREEILI